jgi:predicted signal transduction protein with EAL and GGDEF domain
VPITADNEDVAALLTAADSACAAAKEAGRNRIHSFQENDIDLMRRRREMQWAARINNALEENRFELFRQTIQPLQAQEEGAHYEILLRMRDENGGIISPGLFIEAAERYGITPSIDRWVIRSAFRWLVSEADERERLSLCSINLSGQSLGDEKFLPFVVDQFQMSGIDATKICFEITETAAIASYSQANRFINALKELAISSTFPWTFSKSTAASSRRYCMIRSTAKWYVRLMKSVTLPANRRLPNLRKMKRSSRCSGVWASTTRRATAYPNPSA